MKTVANANMNAAKSAGIKMAAGGDAAGADILARILAAKAREVARNRAAKPLNELRAIIDAADATDTVDSTDEGAAAPRGFADAIAGELAGGRAAVIAEIKKASPSKGVIRADFNAAAIARDYAANGATCLSVLTDESFFHGNARDLIDARAACALPALRKDFVVDAYQVYESRALGADAVLLIAAALDDSALNELAEVAAELKMDALVEVHDAAELKRALALPCRLIGINNRNLRTFETTLDTTLALLDSIPQDRIVVTESGIHSCDDVSRMREAGLHAFLIGEAFMRASQPGAKLKNMFGK